MIKKRETSVQNITFIAIIVSIIGVISVMSAFIPFFGIIISLIVPLGSVLVVLYCKPSYYLIYIFSAVGLCLSVTLYNLENTIFYIIPGLITGLIFGLCLKAKFNPALTILFVSIIQALFNLLAHLLIFYIYEINILQTMFQILRIESKPYINSIIPLGFLLFGLMQFILTYLVIYPQIVKFFPEITDKSRTNLVFSITGMSAFILATGFSFLLDGASYLFMGIGLYCSVYLSYILLREKRVSSIVYLSLSLMMCIGLFIGLNQIIVKPYSLLIFNAYNFLVALFVFTKPRLYRRINNQ